MRIGAHVSSAGGISKAVDRAVEIGAETIQLFCSPPQGWKYKPPPEGEIIAFREKSEGSGHRAGLSAWHLPYELRQP